MIDLKTYSWPNFKQSDFQHCIPYDSSKSYSRQLAFIFCEYPSEMTSSSSVSSRSTSRDVLNGTELMAIHVCILEPHSGFMRYDMIMMLIIPRWISVTTVGWLKICLLHPSQADARSCTYSMLQRPIGPSKQHTSGNFTNSPQPTQYRIHHHPVQFQWKHVVHSKDQYPQFAHFSTATKAIPKALEQVFFSLPVSSQPPSAELSRKGTVKTNSGKTCT